MPHGSILCRHLRWTVLLVGLFVPALSTSAGAESQTAPRLPEELRAALQERDDGKLTSAILRLQRFLADPSVSLSTADRWDETVELLYMCRSVRDTSCLTTYLSELNAIRQQFPSGDTQLNAMARLQTLLLFHASLAFLGGNAAMMQQTLASGALNEPGAINNGRAYIDRQLLLARYHLALGNPEAARLAIDRAFTLVLSIADLRQWRFFGAQWLSEIMELLLSAQDLIRAYGIYAVSHSFIVATLPHTGLDYAEHQLRTVQVLTAGGQLNDAREAARNAQQAITQLEISKQKRLILEIQVSLSGSLVCASNGEAECARQFLDSHPLAQDPLPPELLPLKTMPQLELPFMALKAISQVLEGVEVSPLVLETLQRPVNAELFSPEQSEFLNLVRQLALAIALLRTEPAHANEAGVAALKGMLHQRELALRGGGGIGMPLIPHLDKLVVAIGARSVFQGTFQGQDRVTLALQSIDVLNRNIRHADSDAFIQLAMATTEEDRRLLHAASRLTARHAEAELRRLREMMVAVAGAQPDQTSTDSRAFDFNIRYYLTAHEKERLELRRKLEANGRLASNRLAFPVEEHVRRVLADDEALIATTFAFNESYQVCVRTDGAWVSLTRLDPDQLSRDIRIVTEALMAEHSPSLELDAEYPVEAALRLYDILLRPASECIRGARHLVIISPAETLGLPVAALLDQGPPRQGRGYDLGEAHWVGVNYGLSYVTSVQGFLAARQLGRQSWASLAFLGVGDPTLSGNMEDGTPKGLALAKRGTTRDGRNLHALPELPETGDELRAVASLFPDRPTLLLREDASEFRVRREPLGQYRVLAFATHGLIKDEARGLTEAALVLTPQSDADPSNDGLLTASEIADLSLNAELAVLSACNTARYDLGQFGVEVQGMATAFAIAGVPRVVATLWPVESTVAERVMVQFFSDIQTSPRLDAAESLRRAMSQAVLGAKGTAYAHPRFWAAFTVLGDGRSTTEQHETPSGGTRLVLNRSAHPQPIKRGEILGVATIPGSTDLVMTGFADPVHGVYQRTIMRLTRSGNTKWVFQDAVGAGADLFTTPDGIYTDGYIIRDQEFRPIVTKIRYDGTLAWTTILPIEDFKSTQARLMILPSGNLLVVAIAYRPRADAEYDKQLIVLEMNPQGVELWRRQIESGRGFWWDTLKTGVVGNRLVVTVSGSKSDGTRWEWDEYNQPRPCGSNRVSTIFVVDLDSLAVRERADHRGTEIRGLMPRDDGQIMAVGSIDGDCDMTSQLMVAEVRADASLHTVFTDTDGYRSRGMGLFAGPNNTFLVLGQSDRVFDIRLPASPDEWQTTPFEQLSRKRDRAELGDALLLLFDPRGGLIDRSIVSGGVSFALSSGRYADGRAIAVGTFGFEWSWVEYEVRQRD